MNKLNKKVGLIALLAGFAAGELFAGTLASYSVGDVLIGFRSSGVNDLVVDAGPISTFTNAAPNQRITITQYTTNQLYAIGLNNLSFSVFTWLDDTVSPPSAQWTLFMSRARTSLNTQTTAWGQRSQYAQGTIGGSDMPPLVYGTVDCRSYASSNTDTAVIEPDDTSSPNYSTGQSYAGVIGTTYAQPDTFNGDWLGDPELTTPSLFASGGTVVRSDFYQVPAQGNGSVKFLGYFELNTNGVMTYVAYHSATLTVPVIKSITRTNSISYVSFTTGTTGTYTLRGTDGAGLVSIARTNWPAITSISGNGSVNTLQDTTSASSKFYVITAQ